MQEFIWTQKAYNGVILRYMLRGNVLYLDYGSNGRGRLNGFNAIKILF